MGKHANLQGSWLVALMSPTYKKYDLTLVRGALLHIESTIVLQKYQETKYWEKTRQEVIENNLLHKKSKNSLTTQYNLIRNRLQTLHPQEIDLYFQSSVPQQKQILWLACCRFHPILKDFSIEVMQDMLHTKEFHLTPAKFWVFFENKSHQFPKLTMLTQSTKQRIKSVAYSMLRQLGILDQKNQLHYIDLSPALSTWIQHNNPEEFLCFPLSVENVTFLRNKGKQ
jgi:hypothetical protein